MSLSIYILYMQKLITKKESSFLKYWDVNHLYGWVISQKLPVNDLKQVNDISKFNEGFIINYNHESDEGDFLEVDVQHTENLERLSNKKRNAIVTEIFMIARKPNISFSFIT